MAAPLKPHRVDVSGQNEILLLLETWDKFNLLNEIIYFQSISIIQELVASHKLMTHILPFM